jgi:hypothetical protein
LPFIVPAREYNVFASNCYANQEISY